MAENFLELNTDKTVFISAPEHVVFKHDEESWFPFFCCYSKPALCNFGVSMGHNLSVDKHINNLVHSSFYHTRNIAKHKPVVSRGELGMIVRASISSRLLYLSLNFLQMVQNSTVELVTNLKVSCHTPPKVFALAP